jgi:hypothetical protein
LGFQLSNTGLGKFASLPQTQNNQQLSAVGLVDQFNDQFKCLNPEPITISVTNNISNPVLVPFVGDGACDPNLPAILATDFSQNTAHLIVSDGNFVGRDGKTYRTEAIRHGSYQAPTPNYPQGYFKFYFVDPSVAKISSASKATATGSLTVFLGYRRAPRVVVSGISDPGSFAYDLDAAGNPIQTPTVEDSYYVNPNKRPLINFNYLALGINNARARVRIWDSETKPDPKTRIISPVFDQITNVSGGGSFYPVIWSPASSAPNKFYLASVCLVDGANKVDGYCTVKTFATVSPSPLLNFSAKNKEGLNPLNVCVSPTQTMPAIGADIVIPNPNKQLCNTGRQSTYNPIYQDVICYESGGPWQDYPGAPYPGDLSILGNLSSAIGSHINYEANPDPTSLDKTIPVAYHLQRSKEKAVGPDLTFKAIFPVRGGAAVKAAATGIFSVLDPKTGKASQVATSGQMQIIVSGVGRGRQHCKKDEYIGMNQTGQIVLFAVDTEEGNLKKLGDLGTAVLDRPVGTAFNVGKNALGKVVGFVKTKKAGKSPEGPYPFINAGEASGIVSFPSNPWPNE